MGSMENTITAANNKLKNRFIFIPPWINPHLGFIVKHTGFV